MNVDFPKRSPSAFAPGYPLAYLLTFTTYGSRLHGDPRGSVNRSHNQYQTQSLLANEQMHQWQLRKLAGPLFTLNAASRHAVQSAVQEVAAHKKWDLHAINVRTNHVHVVISADAQPEPVMNALKSRATRKLRAFCVDRENGIYWTRHGSTKYLWTPVSVSAACRYVLEDQGEDLS